MRVVNVEVEVAKQEDGLWRASVPGIDGCFVDSETMEEALRDIQDAVAMYIDLYEEHGKAIPESVSDTTSSSYKAALPIALGEHAFRRLPHRSKSASQ